jgi:pimeloyl-ACP methyl ester carboxylesterase
MSSQKTSMPKEMAAFRSATATVNAVRLHYWVGGNPDGPPVLLWHGFLGTSYSWHKVMPFLAEAGYAVLVPDMRGFGDSDKPAGTEGYDGRALAEEFRALRQQIGFGAGRPLTLVAHDMGAPPALLWAADHPDEVAGLIYVEGPVMLQAMLGKIIAYTPEAMAKGSFWWWVLPLAPGVPEILIVGREREFLNWFYQGPSGATREAISPESVNEYLRTFSGKEGVLGAEGVYRAAFTTIAQTAPLQDSKVKVPVVAMGGERGLGARVGQFVSMVASEVSSLVLPGCGHFIPEERPDAVVDQVLRLTALSGAVK